ncbi:MAG: DUF4386 family protein [Phenylobacterium sp.]|uniref:DUF4386 family protein n=1 Tax=Phenylobacterium sp. TaxID=1871053 RepID=UPI001A3FB1BC|nr:DUF4386 family protein [Phenylobacterium sp.]MBL8771389.1 DUF4386 family protein [Phenylobacterium sp.]
MTQRPTERQALAVAGVLYLAAFPLYGGGQYLLQNEQPLAGLGLILGNSAVVVAIGLLLRPIIAVSSPMTAAVVLWGRVLEGLILASGPLAYVALAASPLARSLNDASYNAGMIVLGAAGVVFSLWMLRTRPVPPVLAAMGVIGYVALAAAMVLERAGQMTLSGGLVAVAGIFEVVFAIWIIARGFRPRA